MPGCIIPLVTFSRDDYHAKQTEMIFRIYDESFHKKIASKFMKAAKTSNSRRICRPSSEFLLLGGTIDDSLPVILCRCAGCSKFSVRRYEDIFCLLMGHKVQSGVN